MRVPACLLCEMALCCARGRCAHSTHQANCPNQRSVVNVALPCRAAEGNSTNIHQTKCSISDFHLVAFSNALR
jgi:hypothetical protein